MVGGLILLDVDGPLNPWAAEPTQRPAGYTTHRFRPPGWEHADQPLRVRLNPHHGPLLLGLAKATGWELVWATTWQHHANHMISPVVGFPDLPVIDFAGHPGTLREWKYPAVLDYAAGRSLVWFDDDFTDPTHTEPRMRFENARAGVPTWLYPVDPGVGLTTVDVDTVRVWITGYR